MDDLETSLVLLQVAPVTYALLIALVIPFVLYIIARWRGYRDQIVDPQLGLKVALSFFAVTAFQLVLAGVTIFGYAIVSSGSHDSKSMLYRLGLGLIVPAGAVLGAHVIMLARTNQDRFPAVRRLFGGYNLLVTGVLGFAAFVLACEALFKHGSSHELGRLGAAAVVVYGTAWVLVGLHFSRIVLGSSGDDVPPAELRPATPPAVPPAPAQPGLPSLGQGAFPPIDKT